MSKIVDLVWDCPSVKFIPNDPQYSDFSGNVIFYLDSKEDYLELHFGPEDLDGYLHPESLGGLGSELKKLFMDIPGFMSNGDAKSYFYWNHFFDQIPEASKKDVVAIVKTRLTRSGAIERRN